MWVLALEAGIAVLLLLGIVWVTWPRRRDGQAADKNGDDSNDD
jgi:hypothetical protein